LIDGNDISIMGKHHRSEHRRGDDLHSIHLAKTKQDIIVEQGINNLNVNQNSFSLELDEEILEDSFEG
jgi:hypothetical protein